MMLICVLSAHVCNAMLGVNCRFTFHLFRTAEFICFGLLNMMAKHSFSVEKCQAVLKGWQDDDDNDDLNTCETDDDDLNTCETDDDDDLNTCESP